MTDTPPDWVLIEAAKRCGWEMQDIEWLRAEYLKTTSRRAFIFRALCNMIQKYEQTPVDRKLLCAREADRLCRNSSEFWTVEQFGIRAIELWEEGFGK